MSEPELLKAVPEGVPEMVVSALLGVLVWLLRRAGKRESNLERELRSQREQELAREIKEHGDTKAELVHVREELTKVREECHEAQVAYAGRLAELVGASSAALRAISDTVGARRGR